MSYLVFQLRAPLSSWGEPAVGETRATSEHPSKTALIGLLGAALGLMRDDEAAHQAIQANYGFAVALLSKGTLLRDYQTTQVPPRVKLKGVPHFTRQQELAIEKSDLKTILSGRDYRQDGWSIVAVKACDATPPYPLEQLADALRQPYFTLYLGRKACVPGAPLWPRIVDVSTVKEAFATYVDQLTVAQQAAKDEEKLPPIVYIAFDDAFKEEPNLNPDLTLKRKDRLIQRKAWQFGDRYEYLEMNNQSIE